MISNKYSLILCFLCDISCLNDGMASHISLVSSLSHHAYPPNMEASNDQYAEDRVLSKLQGSILISST